MFDIFTKSAVVVPEDAILSHYRGVKAKVLMPLRPMDGLTLSTVTQGLGDTMMLTDFPKACAQQGKKFSSFSLSPHFRELMKFNPYWKDSNPDKAYMVNAPDLVRQYNCGNGHYIQRIRRAFGLKVDDIPKGSITWKGRRFPNRVILHFDAGRHALWQRKEIHPKARMLYPENKAILEAFIAAHPELEFVQVGQNQLTIKGVQNAATPTTEALINMVASGSWFIGIISGVMHVAVALDLRCIVVINFPSAKKIYLPTLVVDGAIESEWMYPQCCHLHQDDEGELVKRYSLDNLNRALNGELYPFWDCAKYAALIHEKI